MYGYVGLCRAKLCHILTNGEPLYDAYTTYLPVNHSLLLSRLKNSFGMTGTVLQWLHSYLSGRSQFVESNDTLVIVDTTAAPALYIVGQ